MSGENAAGGGNLQRGTVRGRPWAPGQSGNINGRPVGARQQFSGAFLRDLAEVWQEHGKQTMIDTAKGNPAVFFATCARLLPTDVKLTVQQTLPGGLDVDDWAALVGLVGAIKQSMPSANGMKAEAVADHVSRALAAYDATPIIDSSSECGTVSIST